MLPALLPAPAQKAVCSFLKEMSSIEIPLEKLSAAALPAPLAPAKNAPFALLFSQLFPTFFPTSPLRTPFLLDLTPQNNRHRPENARFHPHPATFLPLWNSHF